MKAKKAYLFWIILSLAVGGLSALLSREGMKIFDTQLVKPMLAPPAWLFPVVWSVLYVLMGIGAARISLSAPSKERSQGLNLFVAQLIVNFFWSLIFFNAQAFGLGFAWLLLLWGLVLAMILSFHKTDKPAAYLQIPYLLWLTFAAWLSYGIWQLNP